MNLLSSTSIFSFFTLISRILGYVRDILIAVFLGASIYADAFFVAFRLPNTFRRLFAEGTFNAAFIPSYAAVKIESKNKRIYPMLPKIFRALVLEVYGSSDNVELGKKSKILSDPKKVILDTVENPNKKLKYVESNFE